MSRFWGVIRYEFSMSIRRKGLWLAYGLLFLFYFGSIILSRGSVESNRLTNAELWASSAQLAFMFNLLLPVVAGIAGADRLVRDRQLRVNELLASTGLQNKTHLLGKYFGLTASLLLPVLLSQILIRGITLFMGAPLILLGMTIVCFLAITVPAYAFITAFSLACPLVIPVRVYQVLFTGYWFWGNFLNPDIFPSLSGTLLQPAGKVVMEGLFGVTFGGTAAYTQADVVINMILLLACIVAVLAAAEQYLDHRSRLA